MSISKKKTKWKTPQENVATQVLFKKKNIEFEPG